MRRAAIALLAIVLLTGVAPPRPAHAVLITVNFTIPTNWRDPFNLAQPTSGWFTFQSDFVENAEGDWHGGSGTDLLMEASFTLGGHTFTTPECGLLWMQLSDIQGATVVTGWRLQSLPLSDLASDGFALLAGYSPGNPGGDYFVGGAQYWNASGMYLPDEGTYSQTTVPEPQALYLLGLGLLPLAMIRSRKHR
jgi:hypothetical protein